MTPGPGRTGRVLPAACQIAPLALALLLAGGSPTMAGATLPCGVLVRVPAGAFPMGSSETDPETAPDEQPRHAVFLDTYDIEAHEVSSACYARFLAAGGYDTPQHWSPEGWAWRAREGVLRPAFWDDPMLRTPTHPVVGVSWFEAEAYCRWQDRRLPTEAEWEKAARGPEGRRYPWGSDWDAGRANGDTVVGRIVPLGSYAGGVSPYGAHDLAGNVWEWVQDWYRKSYYAESPRANPPGPAEGESRVLRGGSWNFPPRHLRAAARTHLPPETRIRYLGFRCARSTVTLD